MEDDVKKPVVEAEDPVNIAAQLRVERLHYQRELRGLELKAYSGVLEALRASGKPNLEKDVLIKTLREFFNISEDRHKAELRMMAYDDKLGLISHKLNGFDFTDDWAYQAQRIYVPMGAQSFSLYRSYPVRNSTTIRDPAPVGKPREDTQLEEDFDMHSEAEMELIDSIIKDHPACNGWQPEKSKSVSIAVEPGTGNEQEIEEIESQMKKKLKPQNKKNFSPAKSPDITEAPRTPTKQVNIKNESKSASATSASTASSPGKPRPAKAKISESLDIPSNNLPPTVPRSVEKPKLPQRLKKNSRPQPKIKVARRPDSKKAKESSEETSSADEGENGPMPSFEESSRVLSPVFSEVIRSSAQQSQNRKVTRPFKSRSGGDRKRNNLLSSPTKIKMGRARPRTPNQKSGKLKSSTPTSGSRRKSKLNEKLDYDEVLMDLDGNDLEKHLPLYNAKMEDLSNQPFERDIRLIKEYKSDDCAVYSETLPINFNHEDMEQVTDGVFKRPLPPSRGPKPWEIKDARLNVHDESISDENYGENEGLHYVVGETTHSADGSQPPTKKQRIKSPLIVNPKLNPPPNLSKVPLPAPVFSTSLSSVNKKRSNNSNNNNNNKPISVVDSLNLHLPTSATASSLAASSNSRRTGIATGGGCSMFSNSSALIAGARGTAPGILQQQRKAQPHILANSKVHQRTFLPQVVNTCSVSNNASTNNNLLPLSVTPVPSTSPGLPANAATATAHTVQISTSPIPMSAISPLSPTTSIPFQNFPSTANSTNLSLGTAGVPIAHVNRTTPGANIFFVQKANGPSVSGATTVSSNMIPIKTPPRAVILRRAQIPRQGNVMILDMQKNQLVGTNQSPPFLQTARILNAPGELSLLDVQPSTSPRKSVPQAVVGSHAPPGTMSPLHSPPPLIQRAEETMIQVTTNPDTFVLTSPPQITQLSGSTTIPIVTASRLPDAPNNSPVKEMQSKGNNPVVAVSQPENSSQQDAQYAQIEAELMQMEQGSFDEVVYEEEVTTEIVPLEDAESTQYIYPNETISTEENVVVVTTQEMLSHNASCISGSSTDTASENEISVHNIDSPDNDSTKLSTVKKVTLSPMGEAKIATEAISRALSLSKSSAAAKKITFSVPISIGGATALGSGITLRASSPTTNHGPNATVLVGVSQSNFVQPTMVFQTSGIPLKSVDAVGDVPSSITIQNTDKASTAVVLEDPTHPNEVQPNPIAQQIQENVTSG